MQCRCHTVGTISHLIPYTLPVELLCDFVQGFVDAKISCPTYAVVRTIWAVLERPLAGLNLCSNMLLQQGVLMSPVTIVHRTVVSNDLPLGTFFSLNFP
jgi:hypothetical protein